MGLPGCDPEWEVMVQWVKFRLPSQAFPPSSVWQHAGGSANEHMWGAAWEVGELTCTAIVSSGQVHRNSRSFLWSLHAKKNNKERWTSDLFRFVPSVQQHQQQLYLASVSGDQRGWLLRKLLMTTVSNSQWTHKLCCCPWCAHVFCYGRFRFSFWFETPLY